MIRELFAHRVSHQLLPTLVTITQALGANGMIGTVCCLCRMEDMALDLFETARLKITSSANTFCHRLFTFSLSGQPCEN